jgi:tRNA dimethylallyltransferase
MLALFGPTAVGKTEVAIALADLMRARGERPVAVSADALQVYAGLEILTGVPDEAQQRRLEHRLISFVPVDTRFSVAEYAARAHAEIDGLLAEGATPIVVGGTGLYLRAALAELELRPPPRHGVRERIEADMATKGPEALHAELALAAPWAAEAINPNDRHRIIRYLELLDQGALEQSRGPNRLWTNDTRHPTRLVGLTRDRDELYERIERRVDRMIAAGAQDEVRTAHAAGASQTARVALGFDQLLANDVDAMKKRTRNFARRQLTWMRKLPDVELVDIAGRAPEEVAAAIDDPC